MSEATEILNNIDSNLVRSANLLFADLNHVNACGMTPLMVASENGSVSVVKLLIDRGSDVNTCHTITGRTALHYATAHQRNDIVEMLMLAGAVVRNELHLAINIGAKNIVRTMVMNGATCQDKSEEKLIFKECSNSPFFTSILRGEASIARYLYSICFFNEFDIRWMQTNKSLRDNWLSRNSIGADELATKLWDQPWSLYILSFVSLSSAIGFHSGRAERVLQLSIPSAFRERLLFQSEDARRPIEEWE